MARARAGFPTTPGVISTRSSVRVTLFAWDLNKTPMIGRRDRTGMPDWGAFALILDQPAESHGLAAQDRHRAVDLTLVDGRRSPSR
jgi:hypothetical protein